MKNTIQQIKKLARFVNEKIPSYKAKTFLELHLQHFKILLLIYCSIICVSVTFAFVAMGMEHRYIGEWIKPLGL